MPKVVLRFDLTHMPCYMSLELALFCQWDLRIESRLEAKFDCATFGILSG